MEIKVIEETKNKLVFEIPGEGHTLCNALKRELWKDKHIKVATYSINHPLIGIPRMIVETDSETTPRKALAKAAEALKEEVNDFKTEFSKLK
jgi:DNA-directed RNA polymerase subunit L